MNKSYTHEKSCLSFDDICELLKAADCTEDELGQQLLRYSARKAFCTRLPLSRQEYYLARQSKIRAEILLCMDADEYLGENAVRYDGVEYTVYKTYQRADNAVELYCAERTGQ